MAVRAVCMSMCIGMSMGMGMSMRMRSSPSPLIMPVHDLLPPQRVPLAFASYWSRKFSKQSEKVKKDVTSQPSWSRIRNFSTSALLGASSSDHISSGLSFDVTQYVLMECLNADLERLLRKSTLLFTEICTPQHIGKLM